METIRVKRKQGIVTINKEDFNKEIDTSASKEELAKEDARIVKAGKAKNKEVEKEDNE